MAGTYQLLKNGKARLQYMHKGERYSETVLAKNDREAQSKLAKFVTAVENQTISNCTITYTNFCQTWLDDYVRANLSPTVVSNYKRYLNNRILPYLGKYKLKDITPNVLRNLFNDMKTWKTMYKPPRENKYISKGTYKKIYEIISCSLQKAFEWEYIVVNPCRKIPLKSLRLDRLPSEIKKRENNTSNKIKAFDRKTYKRVLNLLDNTNNTYKDKDSINKICTEIALKTGLCLSELAGLEWERDWNQKRSTLSISIIKTYITKTGWITKEPKEPKRTRVIALSKKTNDLLKKLRKEYPNEKYIFFNLINFNTFTNWLKKWQIQNNIYPIITAHDLRHTHATLLLQKGIPVKYISERLGHASTKITEDVYIEYLKEHDETVANIIDKI